MHRLIATVVLLSAWILQANSLLAAFGDERAIFFDRYDYPYTGNIAAMTAEINTMMQDADDQGFTNVIWQVRGRADALYNSNYEPSVYGLTSGFESVADGAGRGPFAGTEAARLAEFHHPLEHNVDQSPGRPYLSQHESEFSDHGHRRKL